MVGLVFVVSVSLFICAYVAARQQGLSSNKLSEKVAEFFRNACIQLASMLFSLGSAFLIFQHQVDRQQQLADATELRQVESALLRRSSEIAYALFALNSSALGRAGSLSHPLCDIDNGDERHSPQVCTYTLLEILDESKNHPPISMETIQKLRNATHLSEDVSSSRILFPTSRSHNLITVENKIDHFVEIIEDDITKWPADNNDRSTTLIHQANKFVIDYRMLHMELVVYAFRYCIYRESSIDIELDSAKLFDDLQNAVSEINKTVDIYQVINDDIGAFYRALSDSALRDRCRSVFRDWFSAAPPEIFAQPGVDIPQARPLRKQP